MKTKIRIARATNDLKKISEMYRKGLGLEILSSFENHSGFDGTILGHRNSDYHLEFTHEKMHPAPHSNSAESLIVFYLPNPEEWVKTKNQMLSAGFNLTQSHNSYWDLNGCTFEDPEGYRIVLCKIDWNL